MKFSNQLSKNKIKTLAITVCLLTSIFAPIQQAQGEAFTGDITATMSASNDGYKKVVTSISGSSSGIYLRDSSGYLNATAITSTSSLPVNTINTPIASLRGSSTTVADADGDGVNDAIDLDDDNDGILDEVECGCAANGFVNGSFESPVVLGVAPDLYTYFPQGSVPGWRTTASDGIIEIQGSGFNGNASFIGVQHGELNAAQVSNLYQTFCVNGLGGIINWSIRHSGRFGVDVANVKIGTSLESTLASAPVQVMTDGRGWGLYTGTYNVPFGATSVTILFEGVSSNGGTGQVNQGNLIDDVKMTFVGACSDADGDGIVNSLDLDSDNDGCSDAFEAGATTNQTPNYRITGAVGTNGLINSLETSPDSDILNYVPNYANATNALVKTCTPPCNAGNTSPTLSATTKANGCPATTVDLTTITATNLPSGMTLSWHTTTPADITNKVAIPTAVTAGTYYATFYETSTNCYGGISTTPVVASSNACPCLTPSCGNATIVKN